MKIIASLAMVGILLTSGISLAGESTEGMRKVKTEESSCRGFSCKAKMYEFWLFGDEYPCQCSLKYCKTIGLDLDHPEQFVQFYCYQQVSKCLLSELLKR